MSSKSLCGGPLLGLVGLAALLVCSAIWGQAARAVPADEAQAAVGLVAKLYTVNSLAKADAKGHPLPKTGTWGVRPAVGEKRVAACEVEGASCDEVAYRAGQPEVVCSWTVLFPAGGGEAEVVSDNEASATYMLRVFKVSDKDRPAFSKAPPLEAPPIARVAHLRGSVTLNLLVDKAGKVSGVELVQSTNPIFNQTAIDAVKTWVMTPYSLDGRPRPYKQSIELNFDPNM
jgi:TonB family protein